MQQGQSQSGRAAAPEGPPAPPPQQGQNGGAAAQQQQYMGGPGYGQQGAYYAQVVPPVPPVALAPLHTPSQCAAPPGCRAGAARRAICSACCRPLLLPKCRSCTQTTGT